MGLGGSVRCNCWERGLAVPPTLVPHLRIDAEGYLAFEPPDPGDDDLDRQFYDAGRLRFHFPTHMHTGTRPRGPEQFSRITASLVALCKAAIDTGNPIRWS